MLENLRRPNLNVNIPYWYYLKYHEPAAGPSRRGAGSRT
jgi:hypothetical protein